MANETIVEDLRKLKVEVVKRMKSKPRVYRKSPGSDEVDVTDELIEQDRALVDELDRIIAMAQRE